MRLRGLPCPLYINCMDFPSAAAVEAYMDPALTGHADTNGTKRGSTDESPLPRAKRNRYISIACNECKRRKIKCNGENPCQRCGNLNLECVYAPNCCGHNFKDSEEWRQMATHIESLQHQVDTLFANLSNLRSEMSNGSGSVDPSLQTSMSAPRQAMSQRQDARTPVFHGPTSIAYTLDVAKSTMQTMGISADEPSDKTIGLDGRAVSPDAPEIISIPTGTKDPIWSISHSEALRLLTVYEEEVHEMYPVISLAHLRSHSETLYRFIEAMIRARMARVDKPGADAIHDDDTNIFKATLAIALTVEGKGHSDLGRQLFENVQPQVDAVLLGNASVKAIQLLALTAMYNYFCDNEGTSWRVIGLTARLCIELGLHRADTYEKMSQQEKDTSVLLFWSIVSLDRRWSFGTGMPFALQETDVDYALPRPGELSPYLTAVIGHCDLGSKVWRAVGFEKGGAGSQDITREDIRYLDYLIRQWHSKLPKDYYFDRSSLDTLDLTVPPSTLRLGLHLYLRQNSLLILIHRPVLYSVQSITRNPGQAQDVIDVARDTITVLSRINSACDIYSRSQALFNPFLTMSLAVLFLGVSHDPAKFAEQVREEYNLALDLVRGFSRDSWIAKRLWRTIRGLKDAAPKLGLVRNSNSTSESTGTKESKQASSRRTQSNNATAAAAPPVPGAADDDDDPSRSAALAMAGLAGHNLDGFDLYGNSQHPLGTAHGSNNGFAVGPQTVPTGWAGNGSLTASSVVSPDHMANDLDSLFAAAEAFSNGFGLVNGGVGGEGVDVGAGQAEFGGAAGVFGDEDELSRIMRDLF